MLTKRPCYLDHAAHRYIWKPHDLEMTTSVTGVINHLSRLTADQRKPAGVAHTFIAPWKRWH